jgi:dihydroflavonol-4-reductase
MTSLVTGATGFVGAAVLRRLVAEGHQVRALVRPQSDRRNLEGIPCEIVTGSLLDRESLRAAVKGCRAVFHVAADYRLWVPDPDAMLAANVEGSRALVEEAMKAGVERIVYTSSVATLGLKPGVISDETSLATVADMIGPYKQSKFLAEQAVRRLVAERGAPVVIVQPAAPIGPRDIKPTPTGRMIVEAASGRMPAYVDTGLNVVHVDDVAAGHMLAFAKGRIGESYILGAENLSLRQILDSVAGITGGRKPLLRLPHGVMMPIAVIAEAVAKLRGGTEPIVSRDSVRMSRKTMFFGIDKSRQELGYAPRPAVAALEDAIAWFRDNKYLG